jgi:hypothetical protein
MFKFRLPFLLSFTVLLASAVGTSNHATSTKLLHQFPNGTRVENIAVRSNGQLLLTFITRPELWTLNPFDASPAPSLIYKFLNATGTFGITEISPDIFAVSAGDFSSGIQFSIWTVNLRQRDPVIHKAVELPSGMFVNGVARLSSTSILGSDVLAGVVYRIDLAAGTTVVALNDETMKDMPGFAVNGIRIRDSFLYYVNLGKALFCRIPINSSTGTAIGPAQIIAEHVQGDDFALGRTGQTAYVANVVQNSLVRIAADGEAKVVAGGPEGSVFIGPTSAQLGRTLVDRHVVYVVSSGAVFNSATGNYESVEGGKVVSVKLGS